MVPGGLPLSVRRRRTYTRVMICRYARSRQLVLGALRCASRLLALGGSTAGQKFSITVCTSTDLARGQLGVRGSPGGLFSLRSVHIGKNACVCVCVCVSDCAVLYRVWWHVLDSAVLCTWGEGFGQQLVMYCMPSPVGDVGNNAMGCK